MTSLRLTWVESGDELEGLRPSWERLENGCGKSGQFFQTWLWVSTWWKHFGKECRKLRVLTGTKPNGELALVWPMAECWQGGLRVVEPAGGRLTCLSDVIVDDREGPQQAEDWLASAWEELSRLRGVDLVSFPSVRSGSMLDGLLSRSGVRLISSERCPTIPVGQYRDFEELFRGFSKGFRREIRCARNHFESLGKLEHRVNDPALPADEALSAIYRFKRDWIEAGGLELRPSMREVVREFLTDYCERCLAGDGQVRISSLRLDGKLIAAGVAMSFKGEQFEYIGGFEHAHRHEGPGKLQLSHSVEHSIASGDRSCNLLLPSTEFKERWTKEGVEVARYVLALTPTARVYRDLYLRNRPLFKAVYHRGRSLLQRFR